VSVTDSDVRHIAALARIGVAESRVPALVRELNGILTHMDALQNVALPTGDDALVAQGMPLRSDESIPVALHRPLEAIAPAMRDGFFLVPRLDTHGVTSSDTHSNRQSDTVGDAAGARRETS
jgi:aspartyl-tRNA(Asn)/glutamyl-tRNA(Gln) amidotransferase subunit C